MDPEQLASHWALRDGDDEKTPTMRQLSLAPLHERERCPLQFWNGNTTKVCFPSVCRDVWNIRDFTRDDLAWRRRIAL
jgi:hypothetical protein